MVTAAKGIATMDVEAAKACERRLEIAYSRQFAEASRGEKAIEPSAVTQPSSERDVIEEILSVVRSGVEIASHVESRSLYSLLKAKGTELPPEFRVDHDEQNYDFYLVELVFSIMLASDTFARSAEFGLIVSDDNPNRVRSSRAVRLFPAPKDVSLFSVDLEGGVGIDAGLNLSVAEALGSPLPYGDASVDATLKAKIVLGPYTFRFRSAALEVKGESSEHVLWRYNLRSELLGANDFKSILIMKWPRRRERLSCAAP